MAKQEKIIVPGVCAGHPEHPELLWVFERRTNVRIVFLHIEIDFPLPEKTDELTFQKFDVDMKEFKGCPYCESKLYFFCKYCRSLSCFSWKQVSTSQHWTCWSCNRLYRMKPKTTPFQVEASIHSSKNKTCIPHHQTLEGSDSFVQSKNTEKKNVTEHWHPKNK